MATQTSPARAHLKNTAFSYRICKSDAKVLATNLFDSKQVEKVQQWRLDQSGHMTVLVTWKKRVYVSTVTKYITTWNAARPTNRIELQPLPFDEPIILMSSTDAKARESVGKTKPGYNAYSPAEAESRMAAADERAVLARHHREMNAAPVRAVLASLSEVLAAEPAAAGGEDGGRRESSGSMIAEDEDNDESSGCDEEGDGERSEEEDGTEGRVKRARGGDGTTMGDGGGWAAERRRLQDRHDELMRIKDLELETRDYVIEKQKEDLAAKDAEIQKHKAEAGKERTLAEAIGAEATHIALSELKQRRVHEGVIKAMCEEHQRVVTDLRAILQGLDVQIAGAVLDATRKLDQAHKKEMDELTARHEAECIRLRTEAFEAQQALDQAPARLKTLERQLALAEACQAKAYESNNQVCSMLNERMIEARAMLFCVRLGGEPIEEIFYKGGFGRGELKFNISEGAVKKGASAGGTLIEAEFVRDEERKVPLKPIRDLIWQLKCMQDQHGGKLFLAQPDETLFAPDTIYYARFERQLKEPHKAALMDIVRRVMFAVPEYSAYAQIPAVLKFHGPQAAPLPSFAETLTGSYCGEGYVQRV